MDDDREQRVADIKRRIEQGKYSVDPGAVADAILRRWRERPGPGAGRAQNECSNPDSAPGASVNVTAPAGPSRTRPIQVRLAWALLGGMQAQIS